MELILGFIIHIILVMHTSCLLWLTLNSGVWLATRAVYKIGLRISKTFRLLGYYRPTVIGLAYVFLHTYYITL